MSPRTAEADGTPSAVDPKGAVNPAGPADPKEKAGKGRRAGKKAERAVPSDRLRVSDGALATIIGLAAHEVPGVVGMAPASFSEGLRRILGVSQVDEGVEIQRQAERLTVTLHVVVAYGVNIPAVAESVVERVGYAAGTFAGVPLDEVKVHVAGVSRG